MFYSYWQAEMYVAVVPQTTMWFIEEIILGICSWFMFFILLNVSEASVYGKVFICVVMYELM